MQKKRMRILIYGHTHYTPTGFGKVTRYVTEHLMKKHQVFMAPVVLAPPAIIDVAGITVLPMPGNLVDTPYWVVYWVRELQIDLVIQHFDVWMLKENWIKDIDCPVVTYAPVDGDRLPLNFVDSCQGAHTNIAMSKWAKTCFDRAYIPNIYIPHGVNLDVFKPGQEKIIEDKFVIGMVVTNGSIRKNIAGQMQAFAEFAYGKPDVVLMMHTQVKKVTHESVNIVGLAHDLGIEDKVVFTDTDQYAIGVSEEYLAHFYCTCDVLLQCTLGEGFGLPIIEAQACGVPVIATETEVMSEIVGDGGDLIYGNNIMFSYNMVNMILPWKHAIIDSLYDYYNDMVCMEESKKDAIENAQQYSWQNIYPLWDKLIGEINGKTSSTSNL